MTRASLFANVRQRLPSIIERRQRGGTERLCRIKHFGLRERPAALLAVNARTFR